MNPTRRPARNQIKQKRPMPVWRVPLSGYVTPRLQKPVSNHPVADAIGFQRLEEGYYYGGAWLRDKDQSK